MYRQEKLTIRESTYPPHAIVLHASIDENDNPVVLLYEHKNKQHILGIYEIEVNNRYKFNSRYVVHLDQAVEQLSLDENTDGFWANSDGKWLYFNMSLQEEKRDPKIASMRNPSEIPFTFNKEKTTIIFNDAQSLPLEMEEVPRKLYALSENDFTFLFLTDKEVKIASIINKQ